MIFYVFIHIALLTFKILPFLKGFTTFRFFRQLKQLQLQLAFQSECFLVFSFKETFMLIAFLGSSRKFLQRFRL
jgi:hypothetical protein